MTFYKPDVIASRPIVATSEGGSEGSPYQLPNSAVTTFDLGSGSLWVNMPANPQASDTVTLKNARGKYFETTGVANILTINANGNELEVPGLHDTGSLLPINGSFATSHPRFATRWIFVPGTPSGTWVIDQDYGAGAAITRVAGDYTLHPSELVMVDTSGGDVALTVPEGLPDDSWFTVVKNTGDQNLALIVASGAELMWPPTPWTSNAVASTPLVYRGESVTYVKSGAEWEPVSRAMEEYFELYYLPTTPVDLTPGQSLLNIALHPSFNRSLIFDLNTDGLLRVQSDLTTDILLAVDVQAEFTHTLTANNADVWARVSPVASPGGLNDITVPINAAFAHSRSGIYGDTRQSSSLFTMSAGDTIGIYGEEVESSGGTSDIEGLLVVFKV